VSLPPPSRGGCLTRAPLTRCSSCSSEGAGARWPRRSWWWFLVRPPPHRLAHYILNL